MHQTDAEGNINHCPFLYKRKSNQQSTCAFIVSVNIIFLDYNNKSDRLKTFWRKLFRCGRHRSNRQQRIIKLRTVEKPARAIKIKNTYTVSHGVHLKVLDHESLFIAS